MKRKSIIALMQAAILIYSLSLVGCGNTSRTRNEYGTPDENYESIQDDTSSIRNNINNAAEATRDRIGETADSMKYGATNFQDDISNAGYKLAESTDTVKNYFRGRETDYTLGGDLIRVYEYATAEDIDDDISRIAPNGLTIRGTDANYTTSPYYYRRGNSLIIYEGNEPAFVDEFGRIYGTTIRP